MHCRDLLPIELGIVVLVEQEQLHDTGREARYSAQLPCIDRIDDVYDLGCWDPDDFASKAGVGHVARVPPQEVVGRAAPDRIEFDPLPDRVAAGRDLVPAQRQHLRRQHLQLQRDAETILRPTWAEPEEHLARNEHLARSAPLQSVEICEAFGVGLVCPVEPKFLYPRL